MAELITTARLDLEPLQVGHAGEMAALLDDAGLHAFTGGSPASAAELSLRYTRQVVGHSADGQQGWLNWVARLREGGAAVGYVQATVTHEPVAADAGADREMTAEVAWVVATAYQGRGLAGEAAGAMARWLADHGVAVLVAHVHPEHLASAAVASRLGLLPTEVSVDGETRWLRRLP